MWYEPLRIADLIDRAAARWPQKEALVYEGTRWTFAQLRDDVDCAAKALLAAGVAAGDHVCLWLGNCPEHVRLFFAISKIGAVLVPINTRFRTRDMAYIVTQSDATTLITADRDHGVDYLGMVEELLPGLRAHDPRALAMERAPALRRVILLGEQPVAGTLDWRALLAEGAAVGDDELTRRAAAVDPDGTAYIMYTSGTTGFPKGVMQGHNVVRNVLDNANRHGVTANDVILDYLPLYHAFAVYTALLMSPATGATHVLMRVFDAGEALRLIESERATMINGFDTHFKDLLEHPDRTRRDLGSLRTGICAAGMLSTEPIARRAQVLMRTMTGYGMTEIGVGITGSFLDTDEQTRVTMSGWPLNGYEVKVIDPATGDVQSPGVVGEICVRGYQVMQGYYRRPDETARTIDAGGWLHTGDSGLLRADGCLRFLGRFKDLLKVGGENVDPTEVESLLLEDARINHAAVVGVPDARLAEVPVVFVIRQPGASLNEADVLSICRGRIAGFKIPRRVFFVDAFPMTGSGKVQKYLLRDDAQRRLAADA
jgi:fatty-acyl-CoA synthase